MSSLRMLLLLCLAGCQLQGGGENGLAQNLGPNACVACLPPPGCTFSGGSCESCGTLSCDGDNNDDPPLCVACLPPPGCTFVDGNCQSCGTLICHDDSVDGDDGAPAEDPPYCVDCAAPPPGCYYVGGSCATCGTLTCDTDGDGPGFDTFSCGPELECQVAVEHCQVTYGGMVDVFGQNQRDYRCVRGSCDALHAPEQGRVCSPLNDPRQTLSIYAP